MKHDLTNLQLFYIVANFTVGSSLLIAPGIVGSVAYEDAWLAMILAILAGLGFNVLFLFLLSKHHYNSIFVIIDEALGKYVGTFINLIIIIFAFHLCSLVIGNTDDFMIVIKPETSPAFYQICMIAIMVFCSIYGVKNLGKTNEVLSPFLYIIIILSFFLLIPQSTISNFKPFFYRGLQPILHGAYNTLGFPFFELIMLSAILTFVGNKKKLKKAYLGGVIAGGSVLLLYVVAAIGVEGAFMVQRETYPTYSLMRDIHVTKVFERVEIGVGIIWIFLLFAKITLLFIVMLLGLQHLSRSTSYGRFILPLALSVWVLTNLAHENLIDNSDFTAKNWTLYSFTIYLIVILTMIIGLVRKRGKQSA